MNASVTNQFAGQGVTFTNGFFNPDPTDIPPNTTGNRIGNFHGGIGQPGVFSMLFSQNQQAVTFALNTGAGGVATFASFLNNAPVESFFVPTGTADTGPNNNFFGFENSLFDEVRITTASLDGAFLLDNLKFNAAVTAVPEPGTMTLMGLGLAELIGAGRKKRKEACEQLSRRRLTHRSTSNHVVIRKPLSI